MERGEDEKRCRWEKGKRERLVAKHNKGFVSVKFACERTRDRESDEKL